MIRLLEGADTYATAQVPASRKWATATAVTVETDAGRSGFSGDNALGFDASLGSVLSTTLDLDDVAGIVTMTLGLALQPLTVGASGVTLLSILTSNSRFSLILDAFGALTLTQTSGMVPLGTICQTVRGVVPVGVGGCYVELQIRFELAVSTACIVRVSDQYGAMNPLAAGSLLALLSGEVPTDLELGGGTGETGTWLVDDLYLNDGVPTATGQLVNGRLLFNDSFLGNTHIQAFYPTADGTNLSVGNTPWVPDTGTVQFSRINEHPPDEDASYISADVSGQTSTFLFESPEAPPFGRAGCAAYSALYGIQWDGRLRNEGTPGTVAPVYREIVGGTIPTDDIALGDSQTIDSSDYLYYPYVWNRNPINGEPFTFGIFYPPAAGAVGTTEIGARLI